MDEMQDEKKIRRNKIVNIILFCIIVLLLIIVIINQFVLTEGKVEGESMLPTLKPGKILFIYKTKNVSKGDIIVFDHEDKLIVKRVIATAGDRVEIRADGKVYLNGEELIEEYILEKKPINNAKMCDIVIAEGELFVLGDNRNNSNDSEDYGPISVRSIVGKVI